MVFFVIELRSRAAHIAGVRVNPDGAWLMQIARDLLDPGDGLLRGATYLIHDRVIRSSRRHGSSYSSQDWTMGYLKQLGSTPGIDYGVTATPGSAGLFVYQSQVLVIPEAAPHLQGALRFLDLARSVEGHMAVDPIRNLTPARHDIDLSVFDSERRGIIQDMMEAKHRSAPQVSSMMGWQRAISAFVPSTPHDTEALVQVVLSST